MTERIKEQLTDKIKNFKDIYKGLKSLQELTIDDIRDNLVNIWAVSFGLIAGIEAVLDISQYLLAEKSIKFESYGQIPKK